MSNLDKFNEILNQFNNKQEEIRLMFQDALKEVSKVFLDQYKDVLAIKWSAYTPYYNDGDTCVFGVKDFRLISNEEVTEEDYDYYCDLEIDNKYYKGYEEFDLKEWNKETRKYEVKKELKNKANDFNELQKFIYDNKELVKFLFGEHHIVIISRDNIQIEEYTDHY